MARPRKQYRLFKHLHKNKETGKVKESLNYNLTFRDHLQIERRLVATPDKSTSEYIAKNITAIVSLKSSNQPLSPELRNFIEGQPDKLRKKLLKWNILDANANAGFEPLMVYDKVKAKHSKRMKYNATGGHVYYWQKSMQANERSKQHISESITKVARVIKGCGFTVPSDITGEKFKNWLSDLRNKGKSVSAVNGYLLSFKAFTRWLLRTDRISQNPIQHIQPLKKLEKERPRRPLTEDEVNRLITATLEANKHHGLTGYKRNLVYRLALGTGLRYNEIYTLKRGDITLETHPHITVKASNAKNKKAQTVPLSEELAKELEQYFTENLAMPHTKVFSGLWKDAGAAMLKPDLKLADIEYKTEEGFADFHSLRHTCGTMLTAAGVHPKTVQEIMRHSDINLTMGTYTHLQDSDKTDAINKLPKIQITKKKLAKTGTLDTPEKLTGNLTENSIKPQQNTAKSSKGKICKAKDTKAITPCNTNGLQKVTTTRPAGLEPATYGLEIRCSVRLSYGRTKYSTTGNI